MIRIPARPVAQNTRKKLEFPMSVLVAGETAESAEMHVCPYLGCARRLRMAPIGGGERGLVCKHHGTIWRSRITR
jgi:hemin uptake protein HemP